ncbi:hypothetical protein DPMN_035708 [Dreissena polymorpha]|uniref:B box-type domain-containing protein n=1 Tax=Dreissena polymorpha TaxID=45954 RepID=A0A9D4RN63_DREPO|nr:hypothetical protein DPMN_035708 [Dreissena polymorpha]
MPFPENRPVSSDEYCHRHANEKPNVYCTKCQMFCCRDCKIEFHDLHPSMRMSDMLDDLMTEANTVFRQTCDSIDRVESNKNVIRVKMDEWTASCEELEIRLHHQKRLLEKAVSEQVNRTFVKLQSTESEVRGAAEQENARMDRVKDELQVIKDSLVSAMDSHDPIKLKREMSKARSTFDALDILTDVTRPLPSLDYTASSEMKNKIASIIGSVSSRPVGPFQGTIFLLEQFTVNKTTSFVKAVLPISKTEAWLAIRPKNRAISRCVIMKIKSSGEDLKRFVCQSLVNSLAQFPDACLDISYPKENKVCCFEDEMHMFELASITNPTALAVFGNELFVCSIASNNYKTINAHDNNRIVVLSRQGFVNRAIEFYSGSRIFSYPGRMAVNFNGDIWVSDIQEGKVKVISNTGEVKQELPQGDALIGDICCDASGRVFVETTGGLIVYDADCSLQRKHDTPFVRDFVSFAVGPEGSIWASKTDGRMHILKYY